MSDTPYTIYASISSSPRVGAAWLLHLWDDEDYDEYWAFQTLEAARSNLAQMAEKKRVRLTQHPEREDYYFYQWRQK